MVDGGGGDDCWIVGVLFVGDGRAEVNIWWSMRSSICIW